MNWIRQKLRPRRRLRELAYKYRYEIWALRSFLGLGLRTQDREILENKILPFLANSATYPSVLFIGCDWYTKFYQRRFRKQDYWTLEVVPEKRKYGSAQHITDGAQQIAAHFDENRFDVIVCNGVIGHGLDDLAEVEAACAGFFKCLKPGGLLLIGWNDVPKHLPPVPLSALQGINLFKPYVFPPLGTTRYDCKRSELQHVFNFYQKE